MTLEPQMARRVHRATERNTQTLRRTMNTALPDARNFRASQLYVACWPSTLMGVSWELNFTQILADTTSIGSWAIVMVREGHGTPVALGIYDQEYLYEPLADLIAWGTFVVYDETIGGHANAIQRIKGRTKVMNKMQVGDRIFFIAEADPILLGLNELYVSGAIEWFNRI